jgi:hypothetical protein
MRRHRRRSSPESSVEWPPGLRRVVQAAERECPRGHADALRELATLALRKVPARGIFDPGARDEEELFVAIEDVARAHLALAQARNAWRAALEGSGLTLEQRDELERSALQVQAVSDTAYFYTGLAFGLAFTCFSRPA